MSTNSNNRTNQSSRGGGRGGRGGRGGGRGGRRRNNYKKEVKPIVKYDGPIVGTKEYSKLHETNKAEKFRDEDTVGRKFIPHTFEQPKSIDQYYQHLQQKMMDLGWRMNEDEDGSSYFDHPTYWGEKHTVYTYELDSGSSIYLPIVNRENDKKGLGCSLIYNNTTSECKVETNDWQSFSDTRKGSKQTYYLNYVDERKNKREKYAEMSKRDKSVILWEEDTPRCNPKTWKDDSLFMEY